MVFTNYAITSWDDDGDRFLMPVRPVLKGGVDMRSDIPTW
jgi:hypothetical protein